MYTYIYIYIYIYRCRKPRHRLNTREERQPPYPLVWSTPLLKREAVLVPVVVQDSSKGGCSGNRV